ncbi:MAG TPA: hypothetical protein VN958_00445 [Chitinophagaceae bacterium]|nr:hypothetical protein [Chitinophagaceae bacterium]
MIKPLRKRHLQIWIAWAVLIPIIIISAVAVRPTVAKDKLLQPAPTAALPLIIKTVDKDNYTISIRSNSDTTQLQLEWINKKTLIYPTATIYKTTAGTKDVNKAELIGRIEARGTYHFALKNSNELIQQINNHNIHFITYDFIHQKQIDIINF